MIIAVDAAGGDFYPENPVCGSLDAIAEKEDLDILLVGPESLIKEELRNHSYDSGRIRILDTPEIIGMDEAPTQAVKSKQNSSIVQGIGAHRKGLCQAFVSAGNTGALLAASVFILGRLKGVQRPTIAATFPTLKGMRLLVDAGANLELKPENYLQFAQMGTIYCREVMKIDQPRVGLINVGEEPEKGTEMLKEVYKLLQDLSNFKGNVEGSDIFSASADVYLCDGFTGNVMLKFGESIPAALKEMFSKTMHEMDLDKETCGTLMNIIQKSMRSFNSEHVGGVPFLGVNGISMVGHGSNSATAMKNMILNAAHCIDADVNDKIIKSLQS